MKRISLKQALAIINTPLPFHIKYIALGSKRRQGGYIVEIERARMTSSNYHRRTVNIRSLVSKQVRKLRICTIIEINGNEVYL